MSNEMKDKQLELFAGVLGNLLLESRVENGTVLLYVEPDDIRQSLEKLRDDESTRFDILSFMAAVDYLPREPRFEIVYELYSTSQKFRARVKVRLEDTGNEDLLPEIDSVHDIYLTANWHERECFDLSGISFAGHPDLRRIVLPDGWDGHPLRKEYPFDGKPAWKLGTTVEHGVRSDVDLGL